MGIEISTIEKVRAALAPHGIFIRGVVAFDGDGPRLTDGTSARSLVLLGNIGGSVWPAFSEWHERHPRVADPLDAWSVAVIRPVAEALGGTAWFPSERPWQPFQQWAMRAEGLRPSPLGILIHPDYGLWHGYRGAIGFREYVAPGRAVPAPPHPCDGCRERPCLAACPAGAVQPHRFDVAGCRSYLAQEGEVTCLKSGCIARNVCPVGAEHRYPPDQLAFHMAALSR